MHEHGFHGVADAGPLDLGVVDDAPGLVEVGGVEAQDLGALPVERGAEVGGREEAADVGGKAAGLGGEELTAAVGQETFGRREALETALYCAFEVATEGQG